MVRRRALWIIAGAVAMGVGLRMGLAEHLTIFCPLRRLTGIPCASCGLTRAAAALCHGQIAAAAAYNLAALPMALFLIIILGLLIGEAITQVPILRPLWARGSGMLTWSAAALFFTAWMVNLYRYFN